MSFNNSYRAPATTEICQCELSQHEPTRIKCVIEHFVRMMKMRGRTVMFTEQQQQQFHRRLSTLRLFQVVAETATEEFAESQILYTFVTDYCKNHPRFAIDGPDLGDLRLKTNFFKAT